VPHEQAIIPLAFHEASVVPDGDNPEAVIRLAKEKPMPKTGAKDDQKPADPMASFSDEQKAAVRSLMDDACKKAVSDYQAAEAEKAAAAAQEDDMPAEEKPEEGKQSAKARREAEAAAKAQAEMSAKLEAQAKELADYKAKLAEERDARLTREYAAEASAKFRTLPEADVARVLREVDEKCSKEAAKSLRTVLGAAEERAKLGVDVAAARYGRGSDAAPENDPDRVIDQAAKALREKDPKLTADEAYRLALRQNPAAYAASKARSQGIARQ
jgi:hypothetical protein